MMKNTKIRAFRYIALAALSICWVFSALYLLRGVYRLVEGRYKGYVGHAVFFLGCIAVGLIYGGYAIIMYFRSVSNASNIEQ